MRLSYTLYNKNIYTVFIDGLNLIDLTEKNLLFLFLCSRSRYENRNAQNSNYNAIKVMAEKKNYIQKQKQKNLIT